jgi:hypothetical protein
MTEQLILELCREVLGAPGLQPDEEFFDYGDSIHASKMMARLEGIFHQMLEADEFWSHSTASRLAELMHGLCGGRDAADAHAAAHLSVG